MRSSIFLKFCFFMGLMFLCHNLILCPTVECGERDAVFRVPAEPPRSLYRIGCEMIPSEGILEGTETILVKNAGGLSVRRLAFTWPLAGQWGGSADFAVTAGGESLNIIGRESPWFIDLPVPLQPGSELELQVSFDLGIPNPSHFAAMQVMPLKGWYPRLWWGGNTHDDYAVRLQAPPEFTVCASGRIDPESGEYRVRGVRSFGVVLSRGLTIKRKKAGDVLVQCAADYVKSPTAAMLLDTAVDVVNYYRKRFGFYPYPILTIIPGEERPMGGYPVAPCIVAIHGMNRMNEKPESWWKWIMAHEIGHQYFLEYVMGEMPGYDGYDWLCIGLGIFADREYCHARELGEQHQQGALSKYLEGVAKGIDTTIERSLNEYQSIDFDFNNVVIHGKGCAIISALHTVLGGNVFNQICQRCFRQYGGKRLRSEDFERICAEESGQDLDWFFDQWVRSNRYLAYRISDQNCVQDGDRYLSRIRVERIGDLEMPVPVMAVFEDEDKEVKWTEGLLKVNELVFESETPLKEALIDPSGRLAMLRKTPEGSVMQRLDKLPWTGAGEAALDLFNEVKHADLLDGKDLGKLGMTLYDGEYYKEALNAFEAAAEKSKGQPWGCVALVWQGHVHDLLGAREKAIENYRKALELYSGNGMRHDQYGILINRQWIEERLKQPFERK
jgi:tetratricopeptide (TPR) repeat protein